jgi:hypothetical protein
MVSDRFCEEFDIGPRINPLRKEGINTSSQNCDHRRRTDTTHELDFEQVYKYARYLPEKSLTMPRSPYKSE